MRKKVGKQKTGFMRGGEVIRVFGGA